jgi:hypothetical protein
MRVGEGVDEEGIQGADYPRMELTENLFEGESARGGGLGVEG